MKHHFKEDMLHYIIKDAKVPHFRTFPDKIWTFEMGTKRNVYQNEFLRSTHAYVYKNMLNIEYL